MPKVQTKFGEMEIEEQDIIDFPLGLPGFEHFHMFALQSPADLEPFRLLVPLEDPNISFIVTDPFLFFPDYEFELDETSKTEMEVTENSKLTVVVIVNVRDRIENATVNLAAPVVINDGKRLGKQVILSTSRYTTRHRLFDLENTDLEHAK